MSRGKHSSVKGHNVPITLLSNDYFAAIGSNLASKTQQSTTEPEFYQYSPTASTVCRLLKQQHAKKATGLDKIPCKVNS